ncbi:radical SAM protein [Fusobacterium nucleatum]|uniref:B12-binding domain-containing radical SAM protein n=1 Tax=Fusobacterium nucleatum TaxID=851 RepID=UPI0030CD75B6
MKSIIFVTISPKSHRTAEENLGIEYLASNLKKTKKYKIEIVNGWLEELDYDGIIQRVRYHKEVLAIGISSYLTDLENVFNLLKKMKENKLAEYYFAGGYGPTFSPEEYLNVGFDVVCIGESDLIIRSLINFFDKKAAIEKVRGICYYKDGKVVYNKQIKLLKNLDVLPFPEHTLLHILKKDRTPVHLLTSKGCNSNCIFCSISSFYKIQDLIKWRGRSITSIIGEIEILFNKGVRSIKIVDDSFIEEPRNENWCKEFADKLLQKNIKMSFRASIKANKVNDKIIYELKRAGFISFSCGIENGSATALKRMGKVATIKDNENALSILKKYGMYVQAGFILFDYATTLQELKENYKFLKKYNFVILKGIFTEMYAAKGTNYSELLLRKKLVTKENKLNYDYELINQEAKIVYECLKEWHKSHMEIYDKLIDPISAPRDLDAFGYRKFYSLFRKVNRIDLKIMKLILDEMEKNINKLDLEIIIKKNIKKYSYFFHKINDKLDKLYNENKIKYIAFQNPFIS